MEITAELITDMFISIICEVKDRFFPKPSPFTISLDLSFSHAKNSCLGWGVQSNLFR